MFAGYKFDVPDELFNSLDTSHFLDGRVPPTWYQFNPFQLTQFLWSTQTNHTLGGGKFGGSTPIAEPFNTWRITEKPLEAYLQTNFDGHWGDMPWSGNLGARYAETQIEASGNQQNVIKTQ